MHRHVNGIPETRNEYNEINRFRVRLTRFFLRSNTTHLDDTLDAIFDELSKFRRSKYITVDITVIAFDIL
ncbi:MAG: hypothetical protein N2316_03785 [Spirochaetes bacterium]|nr:hypothetical protein [Spirochaetota bacterium]